MLLDGYNRIHDYLRISLTDRCNFRCNYCIPYDLPRGFFANAPRMTAEEIDKIVSVFVRLGVKKIRFTGGEPLLRRDVDKIMRLVSLYPVVLAITTNGVFVDKHIDLFKETGLRSVNVSLDSFYPKKFLSITRRNNFEKVFSNIHLLLLNNFCVKVNVVVMKGVNDDEILDFVEWTRNFPLHIRFIEFMPFNGNKWESEKVFPLKNILSKIESHYDFIKLKDEIHDTAKKYKVLNYQGTFAAISTISEPFCADCNRLRLMADGKMKNCLFSKDEVDLLSALRKGEDVYSLIQQSVLSKKEKQGGQINSAITIPDIKTIENRSTVAIGG